MGWETLIATALGGVLGVGATLLTDLTRWRREQDIRRENIRREIYAEYLSAISRTYGLLVDSARETDASLQVRVESARSSLRDGGAFEMQQQIRLIAPNEVVQCSKSTLDALRDIRTLIIEGSVVDTPALVDQRAAFRAAEDALREHMRRDLENGA